MNFWWCNQTKLWQSEMAENIVCASKSEKSAGNTNRKTVLEAKAGDIIAHYRREQGVFARGIFAFSQAKEDGKEYIQLPVLADGGDYGAGWRFLTEYHKLEIPVNVEPFRQELVSKPCKGHPLYDSGKGKQGYFYHFNVEGMQVLVKHASGALPPWLSPFGS
jgi:hypothetical protein